MAHTLRDKAKLLRRVRRIQGQVEAIERLLDEEQDSSRVLQTIAACRGAMNGLMVEVLAGHVRFHVLDPRRKVTAQQSEAADELIDLIGSYLR
ncbi:MAG: metal/formaldehyde-sensitive transcriptional repressor [Candidatus Eisenbacteria bacterium]